MPVTLLTTPVSTFIALEKLNTYIPLEVCDATLLKKTYAYVLDVNIRARSNKRALEYFF